MASIRKVGIRGAAVIQFGSKYASIAAQLLITAVLARIITPGDFGILAIVTVFLAFFSLFADMGISTAIVQFRDLDDRDFGPLFVFSLLLALLLVGLFCAASLPISWVYGDERLVPLCCVASLSLFFSTANMVPNGLMLREKDFVSIGARLVVATFVSGALAVLMAMLGFGCYALVVQSVISAMIVLVWNIVRRPIRCIGIHFAGPLRKVFSYSAFQLGFNLINYFARNLDNLLVGKFLGAAALGYYDKAYKLTTYPLSAITSVISSVIQPYMAEHQDNKKAIFECWLKIQKVLSLVAVPITVVFFCASAEIIHIVYGDQWDVAIPLFRLLALSVYFQMFNNTSGAFFQSLGKTNLLFATGLVNSAITVIGIAIGVSTGSLELLSVCVSTSYCFHTVAVLALLVKKAFGESPAAVKVFFPEIALGLVSGLLCSGIAVLVPESDILGLIWKTALVAVVLGVGYWRTGQLVYFKDAFAMKRGE